MATSMRILRQRVIERDGDYCWICNRPTKPENQSLDHVKPKSKGGRTKMSNLKLAHMSCNRRKGNRKKPPILVLTKEMRLAGQ